jgi:hypothetical protein
VTAAPASFLEPALLARISDLALLARTVVDGFMHGQHRSLRKGSSLDFAEHRSYQPGDDLRRIDWRVYGRTDRFYIKQYDADTNASVLFALDQSGSMDFGSGAVTKFEYARFLTASLAWLSQQQGDRIGLATFTGDLVDVVPPSVRHLQLMLHTLARTKATGASQLVAAIEKIGVLTQRTGIVVLITDCYERPDALGRSIDALRMRGHDVIVFHVVDPAELSLPGDMPATFEDAESGALLPLRPGELRDKYQALLTAHHDALAKRIAAAGADYVRLNTSEPLDRALHAYLDARLSRSRVPGRSTMGRIPVPRSWPVGGVSSASSTCGIATRTAVSLSVADVPGAPDSHVAAPARHRLAAAALRASPSRSSRSCSRVRCSPRAPRRPATRARAPWSSPRSLLSMGHTAICRRR